MKVLVVDVPLILSYLVVGEDCRGLFSDCVDT